MTPQGIGKKGDVAKQKNKKINKKGGVQIETKNN